jgi:hypothetical protein
MGHAGHAHAGDTPKAYGSVLPNRFMALLGPRLAPGGPPRAAPRFLSCTTVLQCDTCVLNHGFQVQGGPPAHAGRAVK